MQLAKESTDVIVKRLKRAHGQIGAVIKMLEEGRDCEDIVMQLAAANKAVSRAGYLAVTSGLRQCFEGDSKDADLDTAKLEKLLLSLA
jgi:DNA-binding FrmR family transcriptional regulator